jgi:hypothetical protein
MRAWTGGHQAKIQPDSGGVPQDTPPPKVRGTPRREQGATSGRDGLGGPRATNCTSTQPVEYGGSAIEPKSAAPPPTSPPARTPPVGPRASRRWALSRGDYGLWRPGLRVSLRTPHWSRERPCLPAAAQVTCVPYLRNTHGTIPQMGQLSARFRIAEPGWDRCQTFRRTPPAKRSA